MQPCNFRFPTSHSCNVSSDLIVASAHFWFHRSLPFRLPKLISSQMLKYHIHVCSSGSWLPVSRSPCSQGVKQNSSSLQDEDLHHHHAQLWSQCLEDTAYLDLALPATCASLNDYSTLEFTQKVIGQHHTPGFFLSSRSSYVPTAVRGLFPLAFQVTIQLPRDEITWMDVGATVAQKFVLSHKQEQLYLAKCSVGITSMVLARDKPSLHSGESPVRASHQVLINPSHSSQPKCSLRKRSYFQS